MNDVLVPIEVCLSPAEIIDLQMLRHDLIAYQPQAYWKCDKRRDAERYLRLVEKLLKACPK